MVQPMAVGRGSTAPQMQGLAEMPCIHRGEAASQGPPAVYTQMVAFARGNDEDAVDAAAAVVTRPSRDMSPLQAGSTLCSTRVDLNTIVEPFVEHRSPQHDSSLVEAAPSQQWWTGPR